MGRSGFTKNARTLHLSITSRSGAMGYWFAAMIAPALIVSLALVTAPTSGAAPSGVAPASLAFDELLVVRNGTAELSPRARALAGKRVRIRGLLVVFEERVTDGFWIAPHAVFQDESGAGSGDLPPASVWVLAPGPVVRALPPDSIPLEVVGRLELGRKDDAEGRPSRVRIIVDSPRDVRRLAPPRRRHSPGP